MKKIYRKVCKETYKIIFCRICCKSAKWGIIQVTTKNRSLNKLWYMPTIAHSFRLSTHCSGVCQWHPMCKHCDPLKEQAAKDQVGAILGFAGQSLLCPYSMQATIGKM